MTCDPQFCFACTPRTQAAAVRNALPGGLCLEHKARCKLPDGTALSTALRRAEPPLGPLEGSLLAYVYNPVFVVASDGQPLKGWTDFAGGGMAVLEDRFGAASRFEHWALENNGLRSLWRPLLLAHSRYGERLDLPALADTLDRPPRQDRIQSLLSWPWRPSRAQAPRRWASIRHCVEAAMANWEMQNTVEQRRAGASSPWPSSFAELTAWVASEPRATVLPSDWTRNATCWAFTRALVATGARWLATMGSPSN